MEMNIYELIEKRKTCREFLAKDVPEEVLVKILDAGIKAPTNNHLREWEFVVLHEKEEKEHALQFVKEWTEQATKNNLKAGNGPLARNMYAYAFPRQYSMLFDAPYVVIPFFKGTPAFQQPKFINHLNPFASIWCVIENIFLAATEEGLACSLRIPVSEENKKVSEVLGVPSEWVMPCYIGIGYAKDIPDVEQVESKIEDKLHFGKW